MSVEGFLLKRRKCGEKHNMYQLVMEDEYADLDMAVNLLKTVSNVTKEDGTIFTVVPPGYRWELVR